MPNITRTSAARKTRQARKVTAAILGAALLLALAACGTPGAPSNPPSGPDAPVLTSIDLAPNPLRLNTGETRELNVTLTPENAAANITYSSASEAVATVSSSGAVTGVSEGSTTITARAADNPEVEASTEVIVASSQSGPSTQNGAEWTKQFGSEERDVALGFATDAEGNLIVVGSTRGSLVPGEENRGQDDAFVSKHAPTGELIWVQQFGTAGNDAATAVAVDVSGDIIIAGYANGPLMGEGAGTDAGRQSAFIRKYSAGGALLWTEQIHAAGGNRATGVAVDGDQYVTITGFSSASETDPELPRGPFIRQYRPLTDGSGVEEAWTRRPEREEPYTPSVAGVATDSQNNVIVVGTTWETREGREHPDSNVLLVKYSQDGEALWQTSYDVGYDKFKGDGGKRLAIHEAIEDSGLAVAVGPDGSIYAAGYMGMTNVDAMYLITHEPALLKVAAEDGAEEWRTFPIYQPTPEPGEEWEDDDAFRRLSGQGAIGSAVAVDAAGNAYLGAYTLPRHPTYESSGRDDLPALLTYGLTTDGEEVWRDDYGEYGYDARSYNVAGVALGRDASLYVVGNVEYQLGDDHHGGLDYYVRRYNLSN